jgi:hypothetical protein
LTCLDLVRRQLILDLQLVDGDAEAFTDGDQIIACYDLVDSSKSIVIAFRVTLRPLIRSHHAGDGEPADELHANAQGAGRRLRGFSVIASFPAVLTVGRIRPGSFVGRPLAKASLGAS